MYNLGEGTRPFLHPVHDPKIIIIIIPWWSWNKQRGVLYLYTILPLYQPIIEVFRAHACGLIRRGITYKQPMKLQDWS